MNKILSNVGTFIGRSLLSECEKVEVISSFLCIWWGIVTILYPSIFSIMPVFVMFRFLFGQNYSSYIMIFIGAGLIFSLYYNLIIARSVFNFFQAMAWTGMVITYGYYDSVITKPYVGTYAILAFFSWSNVALISSKCDKGKGSTLNGI